MVQDELQRRASLYSSKNPSRYSSKYALSGKVICGECGAKYRRVTWSRNGTKKIVWRCSERLKNGIKNCKNSPTIYEEDLHNAICNSLKELLPKSDDISKRIRNEIETALNKNNDNNPQVIKRKIEILIKEIMVLRNILKETDDKEFYLEKIQLLEGEKLRLEQKYATVHHYNTNGLVQKIYNKFEKQDLNINEYFDAIAKNIIKFITIEVGHDIKISY